jgi:hypothetical protein
MNLDLKHKPTPTQLYRETFSRACVEPFSGLEMGYSNTEGRDPRLWCETPLALREASRPFSVNTNNGNTSPTEICKRTPTVSNSKAQWTLRPLGSAPRLHRNPEWGSTGPSGHPKSTIPVSNPEASLRMIGLCSFFHLLESLAEDNAKQIMKRL